MNPTVSIIVPVFNAKSCLRRCVDSILGQEYKDFELILVDDGSQDGSGAICDEYAALDGRVRVLHKDNSGVSASRNAGIALAKGTFLQFADSDDWITPDATRLMARTALDYGCDLVITDFYRVVGERVSHKGDIDTDGVMTREEFAAHMMEDPADFYYGVLWNKLYRRELVINHGLSMDTRISWCEDFMFNLEYIRYGEVFYALRTPTYYYVRTRGSLASQGMSLAKSIKMKRMVFEYYNNLYKHILDEDAYEKNRLQVYRFLIDAASDGIVPPFLFPSSKRLGEERPSVCSPALGEDGILMDIYRSRKLLEYYLRPAAQKNDLDPAEVWVLFCVSRHDIACTRRELSDLTQLSPRRLFAALQKLAAKHMIEIEEMSRTKSREKRQSKEGGGREAQNRSSRERRIMIRVLPECSGILADFDVAEEDYRRALYDGFNESERELFERLSERARENCRQILDI